jgi:hypothetical protein
MFAHVTIKEKIFIIGGFVRVDYPSEICEMFNIEKKGRWNILAHLHQPKHFACATLSPDKKQIYAFGGAIKRKCYLERYDV